MSLPDKRQDERIAVDFEVDCEFKGNFVYEVASNLSEQGIFIATSDPFTEGTPLKLRFTLPEIGDEITVNGEVKWVNSTQDQPGMGVEFTRIRDVDKETIMSLIKRLAVL